jgi:hypothetical protein
LQPELLGVEQFTDFVDQLAEAGWVFLFCGKAAEMHPVFFSLALHGASSISYQLILVLWRRWCPPFSARCPDAPPSLRVPEFGDLWECALAYRQRSDDELGCLQTLRLQAPA